MKHADVVTGKMDRTFRLGQDVWREAVERSADYAMALVVTGRLEKLENTLPYHGEIRKLTIRGEVFTLLVKCACGRPHGGDWRHLVLARCESDASLNLKVGGGTTEVTIVAEPWHEAILNVLNFQQVKPESCPSGPNPQLFLPYVPPDRRYTRCFGETRV